MYKKRGGLFYLIDGGDSHDFRPLSMRGGNRVDLVGRSVGFACIRCRRGSTSQGGRGEADYKIKLGVQYHGEPGVRTLCQNFGRGVMEREHDHEKIQQLTTDGTQK